MDRLPIGYWHNTLHPPATAEGTDFMTLSDMTSKQLSNSILLQQSEILKSLTTPQAGLILKLTERFVLGVVILTLPGKVSKLV